MEWKGRRRRPRPDPPHLGRWRRRRRRVEGAAETPAVSECVGRSRDREKNRLIISFQSVNAHQAVFASQLARHRLSAQSARVVLPHQNVTSVLHRISVQFARAQRLHLVRNVRGVRRALLHLSLLVRSRSRAFLPSVRLVLPQLYQRVRKRSRAKSVLLRPSPRRALPRLNRSRARSALLRSSVRRVRRGR